MADKVFAWWIYPQEEFQGVFDEFVVVEECFRVRVNGPILELYFEGSGTCSPGSAKALANRYVELLAAHLAVPLSLLTEEEFLARTTPPFGVPHSAFSRRFRSRKDSANAARAARNEMLKSADMTLRECYDRMQDAVAADEAAYEAYKAIEVLEEEFGGEQPLVAAFGKIVKDAKRAANAKRHIPQKFKQPKNSAAVELTREVIRLYEASLLKKHSS